VGLKIKFGKQVMVPRLKSFSNPIAKFFNESQIESHRLKSSLYGGNRIAKTVVQIAI